MGGTDHLDASPRLRDPEQNMSVLEAMVFSGEDTQVLSRGQVPSRGSPGCPFRQVNLGDCTTFPEVRGSVFT